MKRNKKGQFKKGGTSGKDNINWKGGIYASGRYTKILIPEHPFSDSRGYYREHRYSAECILGRFLNKEEVLHHIDGDNHNNNTNNLYLFPNHSKHMSYHLKLRYNKTTKITKSNLCK